MQLESYDGSKKDGSNNDVAKTFPEYDNFHECERQRSIVLSGVRELSSSNLADRVQHDFNCVVRILSYLGVESFPMSMYRLGKLVPGRNRLIKVVLPSTFHQRLTLKRAPHLRFFPVKGLFIRPSLTLAERKARKEEHAIQGTRTITQGQTQESQSSGDCVAREEPSSGGMDSPFPGSNLNSAVVCGLAH